MRARNSAGCIQFTRGSLAKHFNVRPHQIDYVIQSILPAKRIGNYRVYEESQLAEIQAALDRIGGRRCSTKRQSSSSERGVK